MLKTIITTITLAIATPLAAETDVPATCKDLGQLAESIMEARQSGVTLSRSMEVAEGSDFTQALVLAAYQTPRFNTDEYQRESITDFRNAVELACFEAQ